MKQVNAIGDACPLPVIKTKKALEAMSFGALEILVDNEIAVRNIEKYANSAGCGFAYVQREKDYQIVLNKSADASEKANPVQVSRKTAVILSADTMGSGDDQLGQMLMKGFVFALTQLRELPDTVLLYNTGARLSVAGSPSLNDLIALETAGVRILTCGTCLSHFGIADQLAVGDVTNMYTLVEEMQGAERILRP